MVGGLAGVVGAVTWAVSLALYQPFMQPHGMFTDPDNGQVLPRLASNNTYWPRDIRQVAILLAAVGVVVIAGPRLRALLTAGVWTAGWLAADLWLDRLDVSGRPTALWLAVAAVAGLAVTTLVATRLAAGRAVRPGAAYLLAGVALMLAAATTVVSAPWDEPVTRPDQVRVEDVLTGLKLALVVMLVAAAVALLAPLLTASRARLFAGFLALAALAVWPATTAYGPLGALGLVGMPVAASLAVATARTDSPGRLLAVAVVCGLLLIPSGVILLVAGTAVSAAMTSIAHNPPVNSADTDLSLALAGLLIGLLLTGTSYPLTQRRRAAAGAPRPAGAPHPASTQPAID